MSSQTSPLCAFRLPTSRAVYAQVASARAAADAGTPQRNAHRRRASSLYGLIIAGSILATSGTEERLLAVAAALVATLAVYWAAETYVHAMAERAVERHVLAGRTLAAIARDGLPLVTASVIPILVLLAAGAAGLSTFRAAEMALFVNTAMLLFEGFRISRGAGLVGWRLAATVAFTGALGLVMVGLKVALGH